MQDFKALICQSSHEQGLIISSHEKLYHCMKQKVDEVENEKVWLFLSSMQGTIAKWTAVVIKR